MNKSKTDYIFRVYKKYGILPIFEGQPKRTNVPSPADNENYVEWCQRVLGQENSLVSVLQAVQPNGNSHVSRLRNKGGEESINAILTHRIKSERKKSKQLPDNQTEPVHDYAEHIDNEPVDCKKLVKLLCNYMPEVLCYKDDFSLDNHTEKSFYEVNYPESCHHRLLMDALIDYSVHMSYVLGEYSYFTATSDAFDVLTTNAESNICDLYPLCDYDVTPINRTFEEQRFVENFMNCSHEFRCDLSNIKISLDFEIATSDQHYPNELSNAFNLCFARFESLFEMMDGIHEYC